MLSGRKFRRITIFFTIILLVLTFLCLFLVFAHSSVTTNMDTYAYNLPYQKGNSFKVVQGYGGLFSHYQIAALDFNMPEGTIICAAREGTIYSYKEDSNEGGPFEKYKNKVNYIIIKHADGSFGCYWHLKKNGVLVKKGKVQKGQTIGISGATGFVFTPHLHFSVKRKLNYDKNSFVQTRFVTTGGLRFLKNFHSYRNP